jgi:anthranilate synthase component 1
LLLITHAQTGEDVNLERVQAEARLDGLQQRLAAPLPKQFSPGGPPGEAELRSNLTRQQFVAAVQKAKDYIAAGDIFQAVLSQRLSRETRASPFSIYRSLRRLNPSPYMYFFDFAGLVKGPSLHLIGASPEMHVRLEGMQATLRPIAGTRPRGQTPDEDLDLERDLLADAKERAEHIMLVDLARNDLGRVCRYGSVRVPELMAIERYSHVMHIVSQVEGELKPELDAFDLMRATFPAGTVSGAPKIRAMQIIQELEAAPRGPYAGAVGYFAYDGSMDTCITIRTLVMQGKTISIQAGAGIVADSDPEGEFKETLNKARALAVAVDLAEGALQPK